MRQNVSIQLELLENYYGELLSQRIPNKSNEVIFFKQRRKEVIRCNGNFDLLSKETQSILNSECPIGPKTILVYGGHSQNEYQNLVTKRINYRK